MSHVTLFLIYEFLKNCIDLCDNFIIVFMHIYATDMRFIVFAI